MIGLMEGQVEKKHAFKHLRIHGGNWITLRGIAIYDEMG